MTSPALKRVEQALSKGDDRRAVAEAERGLAGGERHPTLLRTVARALTERGRFSEAGELLNEALAANRNDVEALCALGVLLVREGRADEAVDIFATTLRLVPTHYGGWLGLANALEAEQRAESALQAYERAARLGSEQPAPLAGMAEIHWQAGRIDAARSAAEAALSLDRFNALANLVLARISLLQRQPEDARLRAEAQLVRGKLTVFEKSTALKTLADALDRLDRIPEAVRAYERMNQDAVAFNQARFGPGGSVENHFDFMVRLRAGYEARAGAWRRSPGADTVSPVARHIFVLGYHRSGNTLAAAVLGALPGATVLEEQPTLQEADLAFLREPQGLGALAELTQAEALRHRELYWDRVRREAPDVNGGVLIDMSPLNSIKLPIIAKLFPQAQIVMCERDPRDVVLSCWRQNFSINAATYQMTDLVRTARHYDAAMRLTRDCRLMIDNPVHHLRYDDLVDDFPERARRLVEAVGLEWSDEALNFAKSAGQRRLRTASAMQIRGGFFDGRRQWERYASYMSLTEPYLRPWLPTCP